MKNKNLNIITLLSALMLLLPSLCKSHEIKEDTIEKIIQKFIVNNLFNKENYPRKLFIILGFIFCKSSTNLVLCFGEIISSSNLP